MKHFASCIVVLLATACFAADLTTLDGKTYQNIKVTRVDPDGIYIMHSAGGGKIKFTELPEDVRKQYGYDPAKAAVFEKAKAQAAAAAPAVQKQQPPAVANDPKRIAQINLQRRRLQAQRMIFEGEQMVKAGEMLSKWRGVQGETQTGLAESKINNGRQKIASGQEMLAQADRELAELNGQTSAGSNTPSTTPPNGTDQRAESKKHPANAKLAKYEEDVPAMSAAGVKARLAAASTSDGTPSLQDAVDYVSRKLPQLASHNEKDFFHINTDDGQFHIHNCGSSANEFEFYLGSMDPTRIKYEKTRLGGYHLYLQCHDDEPHVKYLDRLSGKVYIEEGAYIALSNAAEEEDVIKLGRAFKRLVEIFGGTQEVAIAPASIEDAVRKIQRKLSKLDNDHATHKVTFDADTRTLRFERSDPEKRDGGGIRPPNYGFAPPTIWSVDVRNLDIERFAFREDRFNPALVLHTIGKERSITNLVIEIVIEAGRPNKVGTNHIFEALMPVKNESDAKVISEAIIYICIQSGWKPPKPEKF